MASQGTRIQSTKARLHSLNERISGFEKQMETGARLRREHEHSRNSLLKESLLKVEKTLNNEIKRRVESNKAMESMFENQLKNFEEKIDAMLCDRIDQLGEAITTLGGRLSSLEQNFTAEQSRQRKEWQGRMEQLQKDEAALQNAIEGDRKSFFEREEMIVRKLGELEGKTEKLIQRENTDRLQQLKVLEDSFCEQNDIRDTNDSKFHQEVLQEINNLKTALLAESQVRESTDDEIVVAVNHYTKALQEAIKLINAC